MLLSVQRLRGPARNKHGDVEPAGELLDFVAVFAPHQSAEDSGDTHESDTAVTSATLYVRHGFVDVARTDTIRTPDPVPGTWHVTGDPEKWMSPFTGRVAGMVIRLEKVE